MKSLALFFESKTGKYIKNLIIGVAAAVVMIGALFKLEHLPYAREMLFLGLGTEAFIFLLLGILPPPKDYYWEKVYPGLDVNPEISDYKKGGKNQLHAAGASGVAGLDDMLQKANVDQNTINRLGESFRQLGSSVEQMRDISNVTVATTAFAETTNEATQAMSGMKDTFQSAANSMQSFNQSSDSVANFSNEMSSMTQNMSSLNRVYETELNDANSHLKTMNQFYSSLANASESMSGAADDAKKVQQQISLLTDNLTNLNQIYGNMLSAMSGRA